MRQKLKAELSPAALEHSVHWCRVVEVLALRELRPRSSGRHERDEARVPSVRAVA
jgi:hypothetical protein